MTTERWNQIKDLVASAQNIDPRDRASFVHAQCGDDEELRREVMSLVESHDAAGEFLETPALSDLTSGDDPATETGPNLVGSRVGAYQIVREIGHGGMGTVYLAVRADNEFRKQVAIKLIRRGMENDFAIRRFRNERQILARLEHPNIARLIDGGATSSGHPYFVMEFVEGEAILAHCESRQLGLRGRVEIFLQACSAVHYAHRRMIIHRDIKPSNILVMEDGTPKLLDFGIAKILDPDAREAVAEATLTGFRLITPAYASPEQMHGDPATLRSDIYSLAVVLWEMITVRREGPERSFELPDSAADHPDRPLIVNLRNVVLRATRPKPEERYDAVEALSADLRKALAGFEVSSPDGAHIASVEAPQQGSIAILPFQMLGSDTTSESYLGVGIADAVITRLSNIGRIAVRPTGAVMRFGSGADALEAGRELNVQFVLEGRVRKANNRVRVTVQLVDVQTNGPVWAASFDDDVEDLLKMEHSISEQVAQALIPQLSREEREYLAQRGTTSAKAHEAYLRGRWYWNKHTEDSMPQALVLFTEAIAEDPKYGRAHAGVADYYIALGVRGLLPPIESFAAAIQSARTAIELDPKLAEAHASLGLAVWMHDRDHETATHHLQLAIALNPDYAVAHDWLGLMNSARGCPEIALACIERARKLDPNSALYAADLAMCQYVAREFERAIAYLSFRQKRQASDDGPDGKSGDSPAVINEAALSLSLIASGQTAEALPAARHFADASGRSSLALAVLARAEAAAGDSARAQALLDELNAKARDYYVSGIPLALANLACNRKAEAIANLQRACHDRDWWTPWLDLMPAWDDLRDHPRFQRFLESPTGRASRVTHRIEDPVTAQQAPSKPGRKEARRIAAVVLAVMAIVAAVAYLKFRAVRPPFQDAILSKLTTNGLAERAVISSDGQYVAYTIRMEGKASLWLKRLHDGTTYQIAGPFDGLISSLQFTRRGSHVAFVTTPVNDPRGGALYLAPVNGGTTQVAMSGISVAVGVSPDASQFAYYRVDTAGSRDQLVLVNAREANAGGRLERVIDSRAHPQDFVNSLGPVWSPDARRIATAVSGPLKSGFGIRLDVIDLNGVSRTLNGPVWQNVAAIAWMKDSRGLLVAGRARDGPFQQLWYVPLDGHAAQRVTNDLNNYNAVGVTTDESALVSVQSQTVTNLYSLRLDDPKHPVQITSGWGRYFDLAWTPDGNIVYASDATGSAEIWWMDRAGKTQRQLTNGSGQNYAPAVSPDGRTIVFQSNRGGVWNIWKMNRDGANETQVTADASDSTYPQFTPDSSAVVYQHLDSDARQTIWKTLLGGGTPSQLTSLLTMYPTVAQDGGMASWISKSAEYPNWMIATYEPGANVPEKTFSFPSNRMPGVRLRWVPGKNAISYVDSLDGVSNIWMIPVATGVPQQLTSFTSGRIYSFDWSRDGTLVYSQGMNTNDVVLMREPGKPAGR